MRCSSHCMSGPSAILELPRLSLERAHQIACSTEPLSQHMFGTKTLCNCNSNTTCTLTSEWTNIYEEQQGGVLHLAFEAKDPGSQNMPYSCCHLRTGRDFPALLRRGTPCGSGGFVRRSCRPVLEANCNFCKSAPCSPSRSNADVIG